MNSGVRMNSEEKEKAKFFCKTGIIVLSIMVVLFAGVTFIPKVASVSSGGVRKLPVYCVDQRDKKVSLSFDAAWGNDQTATILDILAKHNVKVTFFMTGGWVKKYPEDVKAIAAAGHDLGNHSENHRHMSQLTKERCMVEIKETHDKVKEITGIDMNLFRPPYGDYNNTLIDAVKDSGYYCIQWDIDSLDWKDYGSKNIVSCILDNKHLGNGSIILMHNGAKYTPEALEAVITGLQGMGYELVPISQLIYTGEYTIDHEGRQFEKK